MTEIIMLVVGFILGVAVSTPVKNFINFAIKLTKKSDNTKIKEDEGTKE